MTTRQEIAAIACSDSRPAVLTDVLGAFSFFCFRVPCKDLVNFITNIFLVLWIALAFQNNLIKSKVPVFLECIQITITTSCMFASHIIDLCHKLSGFLVLGTIKSLNYPSAPDNNIYCEYLIEPHNVTENSGLVSLFIFWVLLITKLICVVP